MGEPNKKMSKADYAKLKAAFGKALKDKQAVSAARILKKKLDDKAANEENDKRRGVKPSGFPMYGGGGLAKAIKEYRKGGKMTAGLKALFAEAPELKEKFGYAKYGMKVKKS